MRNFITTNDNFIWAVLQDNEPFTLFNDEDFNGYLIFPDENQLKRTDYSFCIVNDMPLAVEIGHSEELKLDWLESCERNNDSRNFETWLENKLENI